jgi:hypothetical protein
MGLGAKIVVRYLDGRVVKGYTQDFDPNTCHLYLRQAPTGGASEEVHTEVRLEDLKAIFFVRTFEGNPHCRARREFIKEEESYGDRVEVTFRDGEVVRGFRINHNPRQSGFFLLPPDPGGNTIMTFVISKAVKDLSFISSHPDIGRLIHHWRQGSEMALPFPYPSGHETPPENS